MMLYLWRVQCYLQCTALHCTVLTQQLTVEGPVLHLRKEAAVTLSVLYCTDPLTVLCLYSTAPYYLLSWRGGTVLSLYSALWPPACDLFDLCHHCCLPARARYRTGIKTAWADSTGTEAEYSVLRTLARLESNKSDRWRNRQIHNIPFGVWMVCAVSALVVFPFYHKDSTQEQTCLQYFVTVCISNAHYLGLGGPWVSAVSVWQEQISLQLKFMG